MFDELVKYKQNDHFFLTAKDKLKDVCNAPLDKSGVYLVYALAQGKIRLIYIGCSGKIDKNGKMFVRKGGIKDRLVKGHQFGKISRKISWPKQMQIENIEALDIYWYVTHQEKYLDCPRKLENSLLNMHLEIFGCLPAWNKEV